jgi:nuclear GTP-binding protein
MSRKSFFKEFMKVVKASDVIIEVVDARDPQGTRCTQVEQQILSLDPNKKIIIVLNKIGTRKSNLTTPPHSSAS